MKLTSRWRHRLTLRFRVWPKFKETHDIIERETLIPVNGIRITKDGRAEAWNQTSGGVCGAAFEIGDDDFDLLTAVPKAGARMPRFGKMSVRAPGTADGRVRKECWLEVPVLAYADAPERKVSAWGDGWTCRSPHEVFGETPEDALGLAGASFAKLVFVESDADVDEDLICREVVENGAIVVLNHRPAPGLRGGVSTETGRRLMAKAAFWTVPGREPWEDGGALRGYQFADRIVRWTRRVDEANRAENDARRLAKMHDALRDRGRAARRKYFLESAVTRFAERVGWPRQRVMARFLDDGIVDWLMRSVENVKPVQGRDRVALLRGRVGDAVNALEFYYRAVESMARETGDEA